MVRYIAALTLVLLVMLVMIRILQLKRLGIKAIQLWLFNRQILLEKQSLKGIYGEEYMAYCKKVRRFL